MTKATHPTTQPMVEQRIDTWLWAARFFKTRAQASAALEGGKITLNSQSCKKSGKTVRVGDQLIITREDIPWAITITALLRQRGAAVVAQTLYAESPEAMANRLQHIENQRQTRLHNFTLTKPDQHTRILLRAMRRTSVEI